MRCCLISMPFQCQISNFAFGNISRPTYPTILGFERKCGNQASLVAARIEASDKTNMSDEICEASKLWTMLLKNMYIHWRWSDWWLFYTQRLKTNEGLSICRCSHVYSNQSVKILVFKQTTLWSQTCQSQSGVSLSLHLGSKIKIYLWPQKQLDVEEYRS